MSRIYGQVVIGPPGSGKTTYCRGMQMYLECLGRSCSVINLDFANDSLPYSVNIDVRELISLENVMKEFSLGPNGGIMYCMEYLLEHCEWLEDKIKELDTKYIIFDLPGQVELFTHHTCVQNILARLTSTKVLDMRLCTVYLVDSFYCCEPATFISAALLVALSMLRLALPHVNVLSKIDLLKHYDKLPFQLNFFTELVDLTPIAALVGKKVKHLNVNDFPSEGDECDANIEDNNNEDNTDKSVKDAELLQKKHQKMSEGICELITDLGLVSFLPCNIEDGETVGRILGAIDKANGFAFAAAAEGGEVVEHLFRLAADNLEPEHVRSLDIQEKYIDNN